MPSKVHAAHVIGLTPEIVDVEVDLSRGLHSFSIVGLPDKAVEEAKDRISAAVRNGGFESPTKSGHVVISLAPADRKKEGTLFDLAIALGYLLATEEIHFDPERRLFLGELGLTGEVRPIRGTLLIARAAVRLGFTELYVPAENAREAALVEGIKVYGVMNLRQVVNHLEEEEQVTVERDQELVSARMSPFPQTPLTYSEARPHHIVNWADVRGQESAKRGLLIAAAGRHNLAMSGPPGTGKTMLARAFLGILPPLSLDEALETTGIHSVAGILEGRTVVTDPPFRSPHHTASHIALVGGGAFPRPGEITLAHNGVLFLDEFPEFERRVIESLRQPLEDNVVSVSRAKGSVQFPANFILIATMNPCPCGNAGVKGKTCVCMPAALERYKRKLSGPIIDRIDLWIEVPAVDYEKLSSTEQEKENSNDLREKIVRARAIQAERFKGVSTRTNSEMGVRELKEFAPLSPDLIELLNSSARTLDLSARAYHRIIKLARTIADLEEATDIARTHLLEALQYRPRKI